MKKNKLDIGDAQALSGCGETSIKLYEKPVLVAYGDVRDITLGPTVGGGESGCEGLFRPGGGGCPPFPGP